MPGFHIDVAGILQANKLAAPGPCVSASQPDRAKRVVAAGDEDTSVWQTLTRSRGKIAEHGPALRISWGHQQSALDAVIQVGSQMDYGHAAQAVCHQHHWGACRLDGLAKGAHPGGTAGGDPVILANALGARKTVGPQSLPVAGARIAPARHYDHWGDRCHGLNPAPRRHAPSRPG